MGVLATLPLPALVRVILEQDHCRDPGDQPVHDQHLSGTYLPPGSAYPPAPPWSTRFTPLIPLRPSPGRWH